MFRPPQDLIGFWRERFERCIVWEAEISPLAETMKWKMAATCDGRIRLKSDESSFQMVVVGQHPRGTCTSTVTNAYR